VGLLSLCGRWYEEVIAAIVPLAVLISAFILGDKMKPSARKWIILLFWVCCGLVTVGFICSALAIICKNKGELDIVIKPLSDNHLCDEILIIVYSVFSAICWFMAMFIVIALTTYYLMKIMKPEDLSALYLTLIYSFEYLLFVIILKLHLNYFFHCIP
ncbi:unnamed protein product, partial [Schistosoma turkestanicum]